MSGVPDDAEHAAGRLIRAAAARLVAAGVASPRTDAELLAAHVLGIDRADLWRRPAFTSAQAAAYETVVAERARRVPLQHLTGRAGFHRVQVAVGPGVFVPRPETEVLVEWGLSVLPAGGAPTVVDLCAGSGAVALAVATARPDATVLAVERSELALAWLRRNADGSPVRVVAGDATDPALLADLDGRVDLALANPPYVPLGASVEPEAAEHDPPEALWGGPDGLTVLRGVAARAAALLRPGGWFGVEHADVQGAAVTRLLRADGRWAAVADHIDLAGRPRFAIARRRA